MHFLERTQSVRVRDGWFWDNLSRSGRRYGVITRFRWNGRLIMGLTSKQWNTLRVNAPRNTGNDWFWSKWEITSNFITSGCPTNCASNPPRLFQLSCRFSATHKQNSEEVTTKWAPQKAKPHISRHCSNSHLISCTETKIKSYRHVIELNRLV